jgi:predicted RNase H-like HicB family nuclease
VCVPPGTEQHPEAARPKGSRDKFLVVVNKGDSSWGANLPDLHSYIAAGESREEVMELIRAAIDLHLGDLRAKSQPTPSPASESEVIETDAA